MQCILGDVSFKLSQSQNIAKYHQKSGTDSTWFKMLMVLRSRRTSPRNFLEMQKLSLIPNLLNKNLNGERTQKDLPEIPCLPFP